MEKAYKIRHIPSGKYLVKYKGTSPHWTLGPTGKTWSRKPYFLIKDGLYVDGRIMPATDFEFIELVTKDSVLDVATDFFDSLTVNHFKKNTYEDISAETFRACISMLNEICYEEGTGVPDTDIEYTIKQKKLK